MRRIMSATLATLIAVPVFAADQPKTEEQNTLYALGLAVGRSLAPFSLTTQELEPVKQGITDAVTGKKPMVDLDQYKGKIQQLAVDRRSAMAKKNEAEGKQYLEKAAKEKGAVKTPSGMIYQSLKEGSGASPAATDKVKVNYRGTLIDGTEFDSSYSRGKPAEFQLNQVIKCWTEGVQMMKPGGKARLVCPPDLAYGDNGAGPIPPKATLTFDVELLEVLK